jgi:hypothetical protein
VAKVAAEPGSEAVPEGPGEGRPWYNAKSVVAGGPAELEPTFLRRRLRWLRRRTVQRFGDHQAAQLGGWDDVPIARICKCGRVSWREEVELRGRLADWGFTAYPVGTIACGSVWSCAVCSAIVRTRRSLEVQAAAQLHVASGGQLVMLTLTLRHNRRQTLEELLEALKGSWRAVQGQQGVWRRQVRPALVGSVTATEVTWGPSGWHPHLHLLLFLEPGAQVLEELKRELPATWVAAVRSKLPGSTPNLRHGVHVLELDASASAYVSKIADETVRADLKSNSRSVWTILDALEDGETWAVAMFSEWFTATKGRRAVVWSRGLKDRFGLDELTDEEIAQQELDGQVLELVPSDQWLRWCRELTPAGVVRALAHLEELELRHA